MKKTAFYAFMMAAVVGTSFTACHGDDDEDGDGDVVATFASPYIQYLPVQALSSKVGVNAYALSDDEHKIDVYHFNTDDLSAYLDTTGETRISSQYLSKMWEGFYGGFTPTYCAANDENEYAVPMCHEFHSGNSALICNPGAACRSLIAKNYPLEMDLTNLISSGLAALTVGDAKELYVCPTDYYTALTNSTVASELGITALPANHRIEFVMYGYVKSFSFTNFKQLLNTITEAGKSVGDGGEKCSDVKILAETDAEGNLTVNKEWQKVDLSDIGHYYLLEAYIRVVDKETNKESSTYQIDASNNTYLGYVVIDGITFESKSILDLF